jgi:hypothetical protein
LERSKVIVWAGVAAAACGIIWWVGFHGSSMPVKELMVETEVAPAGDTAQQKEAASAKGGATKDANQPKEAAKAAATKTKEPGGTSKAPGASTDPNKARQAQQAQKKAGGAEPNAPGAAAKAAAKPGEAKPPEGKPGQAKVKEDPNDPLEAVNLKDVEMKNIIEKIARPWVIERSAVA